MQVQLNENIKLKNQIADAENLIMIKDNDLKTASAKLREMNKESRAVSDNY
jgi:hypothetical protein